MTTPELPPLVDRRDVLFNSAQMKVNWANHQIYALHSEFVRFSRESHDRIRAEANLDHSKNALMLYYALNVPPKINLLIGDIVHELSTALDHMYSELIEIFTGKPNKRATFPFHKDKKEFTQDDAIKQVVRRGVPRKLVYDVIVDRVRPFETGNRLLWVLRKLDNIDKHRQILTLIKTATVPIVDSVNTKQNLRFAGITFVMRGEGTISVEDVLGSNLKITQYDQPTLEILFNEPGLSVNQPVLPTLVGYGRAVAEAINVIGEATMPYAPQRMT